MSDMEMPTMYRIKRISEVLKAVETLEHECANFCLQDESEEIRSEYKKIYNVAISILKKEAKLLP